MKFEFESSELLDADELREIAKSLSKNMLLIVRGSK